MSKEDTQHALGKIVDRPMDRDAIHIAVVPVSCKVLVYPSQHVAMVDPATPEVTPHAHPDTFIGIVDPFLTQQIYPGQDFWLFLYPNTITSLKHTWTHPAFPDQISIAPTVPAVYAEDKKAASETWLREFIDRSDCPSYETLIETVNAGGNWSDGDYVRIRIDDEYFMCYGTDAHGEIPPEFWDHVEIVTGRKLTARPEYFSCSC